MKIYTKQGDEGETSLFGGDRVNKSNERVNAYGEVDEANSFIGLAAAAPDMPDEIIERLFVIMSDLFDLGAELATPPVKKDKLQKKLAHLIDDTRITHLESWIDEADAALPTLTHFILPSGNQAVGALHVARAVTRRAERAVAELALSPSHAVRSEVLAYLNRLSDLLFVWARLAAQHTQVPEIQWIPSADRES